MLHGFVHFIEVGKTWMKFTNFLDRHLVLTPIGDNIFQLFFSLVYSNEEE